MKDDRLFTRKQRMPFSSHWIIFDPKLPINVKPESSNGNWSGCLVRRSWGRDLWSRSGRDSSSARGEEEGKQSLQWEDTARAGQSSCTTQKWGSPWVRKAGWVSASLHSFEACLKHGQGTPKSGLNRLPFLAVRLQQAQLQSGDWSELLQKS